MFADKKHVSSDSDKNHDMVTFKPFKCLDQKSLTTFLESKFGVISDCLLDNHGDTQCLYFQDAYMKDIFNFYPDRMCIDITHKYFDLDVFLYLFICEDSNGQNEIVALSLLLVDDYDTLAWLLSTFKKHNPNWRRTKLIIVDPEIKQREIIRKNFPTPYVMICRYHALRAFKTYIDDNKNMPSVDERKHALELFRKMLLAFSPNEFDLFYQQYLELHHSLVCYFQEVWMPMQYQWRTTLNHNYENIFMSLNLQLENIDSNFKPIFHAENNLDEFIKRAFFAIILQRKQKKYTRLNNYPVLLYSRYSPEYQISRLLTPYAAKFVIDQLDFSGEINMDCSVLSSNYVFEYSGSTVSASTSMCSCQFFLFTLLPCRHIFAVRKALSLCIFEENSCDYTWTGKYYQNTVACTLGHKFTESSSLPSEPDMKLSVVSNLVELMSQTLLDVPEEIFLSRMEVLTQLVNFWEDEKDVYINFEGIQEKCYLTSSLDSKRVHDCTFQPVISKSRRKKCLNEVPKPSPVEKVNNECETSVSTSSELKIKHGQWNFKSKMLSSKPVNYPYLCRVVCHTKEDCIEWLRHMELIPRTMLCPACGCEMSKKVIPRLSDGAVWACSGVGENKKSCARRCSVRRGSWFELTNMTFEQILTFCYMWINKFNQQQIVAETGISTATYISWNKFNRRICEEILQEGKDGSPAPSAKGDMVLDAWLKKNAGEDTFIKFLRDAAAIYQKDSTKGLMH